MNFIITLLLLFIILSVIISIHEFGHFITAKKCGVYVDEFALGMGPVLWKHKPKNSETTYNLRAFPIGGFVSMAEKDIKELKLKKKQILENKTTIQKLCVLLMGIVMNFILAIVLFFISGLLYGRPITNTTIGAVLEDSPAYNAGFEVGDSVLSINNHKVDNWDDIILEISAKKPETNYSFIIEKSDGSIVTYDVIPNVKVENDTETRSFGIGSGKTEYKYGFINAVIYGFEGFRDTFKTIFNVLESLFVGKVSLDNLSGPVGIYSIVDTLKSQGLSAILYLTAYLSINVGIINLIPIPVFDGGRVLLVIIEAITKKKSSDKIENILNYIGFSIMIILMLYVTFNDIIRLTR